MTDKCWADTLSKAELAAAFAETAAGLVNRDDLHSDLAVTTLEEQIYRAASLSRALWLAIEGVNDIDSRDKAALYELASSVADHACAAKYAFNRDNALEAERAAKAAAEADKAAPAPVAEDIEGARS